KINLMAKYPFTERQTNAILDLRLYQLTGLEREKIENEYQELMKLIEELRSILNDETKLLEVIRVELMDLRKKYTTERRTKIIPEEGEFKMEDVIANEGCVITVTHKGFIKRTGVNEFRSQKRGGKGVIGTGQHDDDFVEHLFSASTHDHIMFFTKTGRVYVEKVYEIPEGTRTAKGRSVANVLQLQKDEEIAAMICTNEISDQLHVVMGTKKGVVKKTNLSEYSNVRKGGIIGIKIDEDDALVNVILTKGNEEVVIITHNGMSIRFSETELRDQGRATHGVRGIKLKGTDYVKAMQVVDPNLTLLIASEQGLGKRSNFDQYRSQSRGGSGIIAIKTSGVAGALSVSDDDEIMIFTHSGQAVRSPVKDIRVIGRTTQGVRLINLSNGDSIVGVSKVIQVEDGEG
ncbi:MAG: DNA gyrase subunit A, partial [Verrucomicrobia bacterium]